jgi:hypothetical protein
MIDFITLIRWESFDKNRISRSEHILNRSEEKGMLPPLLPDAEVVDKFIDGYLIFPGHEHWHMWEPEDD